MFKEKGKVGSTISFYGLSLFSGDMKDVLEIVENQLSSTRGESGKLLKIYTPNPEQMVMAWDDETFFQVLSRGDMLLPDGAGLVWAMNRQQRHRRVVRIAGREVFHRLLVDLATKRRRIFLLGGKPGGSKKIIHECQQLIAPDSLDWMFDDRSREDEESVLEKIRVHKPEVLFVGYGAPWQESWIDRHQAILEEYGVRVAMVVGGAIDYESHLVPSVPKTVERLNLEWLWRLAHEPWRWKRQLQGLQFFYTILMREK